MKKCIYETPVAMILSIRKDQIITASFGSFNGEEEVFTKHVE